RGLALLRERLEATQGPSWRQRCLLVLPALRPAPLPVPIPSQPIAATAASGGAVVIKSLGIATLTAALARGVCLAAQREVGAPGVGLPTARLAGSPPGRSTASSAAPAPGSRRAPAEHPRLTGAPPQLVPSAPAPTRAPVANAPQESAAAAAA